MDADAFIMREDRSRCGRAPGKIRSWRTLGPLRLADAVGVLLIMHRNSSGAACMPQARGLRARLDAKVPKANASRQSRGSGERLGEKNKGTNFVIVGGGNRHARLAGQQMDP